MKQMNYFSIETKLVFNKWELRVDYNLFFIELLLYLSIKRL